MKIYISLFLSLMFFSCSQDNDNELNSETILLTSGISSIKFGDSAQTVFEVFGEVESTATASGSEYYYSLNYREGVIFISEQGASKEIDPTLRVIIMSFESPFEGVTEEGISNGSTKQEVIEAYGDSTIVPNVLEYEDLGLFITFYDGLVDYILIQQ